MPSGSKKKKKVSKASKAKMPYLSPDASGFEEYFADVPIRPQDFELEKELYAPDKPAIDRIQLAISRFYGSRRLDSAPWLKAVFDAYLSFAGLEISEATSLHEAAEPVNTSLSDTSSDMELDFAYCSQAFMSSRCEAAAAQSTTERLELAPQIINNFLLFLIRHNVVPEWNDQLESAIRIGHEASVQMSKNKSFSVNVPDDLSVALSTLLGGNYRGLQDQVKWLPDFELPKYADEANAKDLIAELVPQCITLSACEARQAIVSVKSIELAQDSPICYLCMVPWTPPEHSRGDESEDEGDHTAGSMKVIILSSSATNYCYIGQRIEANFMQPIDSAIDWWFMDSVTRTWPSYYVES